jgi:hypothetical protein
MAVCQYHPDRPGIGICMRCRVVICAACSTRVDGINHCHACLKALGQRQERPRAAEFPPALAAVFCLALTGLIFFVFSLAIQGSFAP